MNDVQSIPNASQRGLSDEQWDELVCALEEGRCTPFLGAGINTPKLPLGSELAQALATQWNYPLSDDRDLMRVAQFRAITRESPDRPKIDVAKYLKDYSPTEGVSAEKLETVASNYRRLAALQAPTYITTNYDDLMATALKPKSVAVEYCRWHRRLKNSPTVFDRDGYEATVEHPLVYYLHGTWNLPSSMVLTEDDYITFIAKLSDELEILPAAVTAAMSDSVLLFIGYSLSDWNFKVIHRILTRRNDVGGNPGVAVQLPEEPDNQRNEEIRQYLEKYFKAYRLNVFWGTASEFLEELERHCGAIR